VKKKFPQQENIFSTAGKKISTAGNLGRAMLGFISSSIG
jgi:hypothetical protein